MTQPDVVTLAHGNGGTQMQELLRRVLWPRLGNAVLAEETDAAVLPTQPGAELVFTTDSFVVQPLSFPGGDIGHLAVCGTINDLAMMGAQPAALSLALIIEAGLPMATLEKIVDSIAATARAANVPIVTGDTKVVDHGQADGLFITTSGVGWRTRPAPAGWRSVQAGDAVLVSGTLGHHGIAVMVARAQLPFTSSLCSDAAPLHELTREILATGAGVRWLRDPTRGGLAAALNELAEQTGGAIELDGAAMPVADDVRGAAEVLGLDPLYLANEGRCVVVCAAGSADAVLARMRAHPLGRTAARIGTVQSVGGRGSVVMTTAYGGRRIVDMPSGEQLPRIC
jgi:hydrogenase expression/formation protein HypE